jgi:hypothetical protein
MLAIERFGELVALGRPGGQGRVYRPAAIPAELTGLAPALKLYRRPRNAAFGVLAAMIAWGHRLAPGERAALHGVAAWPLAILERGGELLGIAMRDLSPHFQVPFAMPSGRTAAVLLSLEHLLGPDEYLLARGLDVHLSTAMRVRVAERLATALALLHRHGIAAGDIAPTNVLVRFAHGGPEVALIDCDSMVFRGAQGLPSVETADWQIPASFGEAPRTRAADAYKLGLVVLRLLARSHDARELAPHAAHVPAELRAPLERALSATVPARPAAGEWQRLLRTAAARPDIDRRQPGPGARPRPGQPQPTERRRAPVTAQPSRARRVPVLMLAWIALLGVLLVLLISRLMAAAAPQPVQGPGRLGPFGGGAPGTTTFRYYLVPPGQQVP